MLSFLRSLWIKFLVLAIPAVLLTVLAFSAISTALVHDELHAEMRDELRQFVDANAAALREPIWSFNKASIEAVLSGMLSHPDIACAQETDALTGRVIAFPQARCLDGVPAGRTMTVGIVKDGAPIGRLDVAYTTNVVNERLAERFWQGVLSLLPLTATLGVVALVVFRVLIGVPLGRLLAAIHRYEREPGAVTVDWRSRDELGEVIAAFNRMTAQAEERRAALDHARTEAVFALRDLQQAQQSLIQAERMASLGEMVAGVAHEINTPVGILISASTHLADTVERIRALSAEGRMTRTDFNEFLAQTADLAVLAVANSQRAGALVQSFKRVAVDRAANSRHRFDLKSCLDDVFTSLESQFRDHGCRFTVDGPAGVEIDGFPGAVDQILINLALNALEHAFVPGQGGRLRVAFEAHGDTVELRCSDDGCGIAPEHQGRIFDPFFTTRRKDGKLGLGLAVVYNLATLALGGSITVDSRAGAGTTFTLRFPRTAPGVPAGAAVAEEGVSA